MATKVRQSIRSATFDADRYRDVIAQAYQVTDDRGYGYLGGIHGYPLPEQCVHGGDLFLPWHRAYLQLFERTLSEIEEDFTVPWWDWTSDASHAEGIPDAFTQNPNANALASAPITGLSQDIRQAFFNNALSTSVDDPHTRRNPRAAENLPTLQQVEDILDAPDFFDFSTRLEMGPHGHVHGWVRGSMGIIASAGFDPIFWSHHAMIDRIWYLWQLRNPGLVLPDTYLDRPLPPFNMTVRDTLYIQNLGYTYASAQIT